MLNAIEKVAVKKIVQNQVGGKDIYPNTTLWGELGLGEDDIAYICDEIENVVPGAYDLAETLKFDGTETLNDLYEMINATGAGSGIKYIPGS